MRLSKFLGNYLLLKKIGTNYFSLCPFHDEKTPSFSVNDAKGLFFCFGCGVSGNKIVFLSLYKKKYKNEKVLLKVENEFFLNRSNFYLLEMVKIFYIKQLFINKNFFVFNYICFVRKITIHTIYFFNLGYAPNVWHFLSNSLTGYDRDLAIEAGLLRKNCNNRRYRTS